MRKHLATLAASTLLALGITGCVTINEEAPGTQQQGQQQQGQQPHTGTAHNSPTTSYQKTSFDCSKASATVEKMICEDAGLAELDRKMADEYQKVLKATSDKSSLEASQRDWIASRNECAQNKDVRGCVVDSYQKRMVELFIVDPSHQPALAVSYRCPTQTKNFTMQFYNNEKPAAALLTLGSDKAVVFQQPSGSGIRYSRPGVEYSEHQGEVKVDFRGEKFTCYTN